MYVVHTFTVHAYSNHIIVLKNFFNKTAFIVIYKIALIVIYTYSSKCPSALLVFSLARL